MSRREETALTCPSCGTASPEGARFCLSCGRMLHTLGDERRVVTVVFADIVDFTPLSEARDPEHVKNLVDRAFERLAADITSHGGRVDKIVGDEIIALFGAPVAHEDDAERAVRAALQMLQSTEALAAEEGHEMRIRVGVNTGEVLVGVVRAGEYTAMGDVVNVGSRLRGLAEPGTVVVGPDTYAATRLVVEYEPLGLLETRGREEPVEAWRALSCTAPPGHRPRRGPTPLVGREHELTLLTHAVDGCVRRRRPLVTLLLGEAGVGKSRLAEELASHARSTHGAAVLEGRCLPYGQANPWWPIGEALREACGIDPADPADVALRKCRATVAAVVGLDTESAEVARIADGLLHLMGHEDRLLGVDAGRALDEARKSLRQFLEGMARDRPVVVLISELHWADEIVLDQLGRVDQVRDLPVILIATARPELGDRWQPRLGAHDVVTLHLETLDRDAAAELLDALLPAGTPADVRQLVLDRSGGNPFFLEELVALLDEQAGVDARAAAELPVTLRGIVAARLDTVGPSARALLEDAAVAGREGPLKALLAMAEARGDAAPVATLDALVSKELVAVDDGTWSFRSDVVREVAYETLTKAERARRHARLAGWLAERARETGREDEVLEQLAHHYGAAAELVAELGAVSGVPDDIADRALDAIDRAITRAVQREQHLVTLHLVEEGLRIGADGMRRRLLLDRAAARAALRALADARDDVEHVLAAAREDGSDGDLARATTILGEIEQKEGRFEESVATLDDAVDAWRRLGDRAGEATALRTRGMAHVLAGDPAAAAPDIEAALEAFREVGDKRGEAWALQNLAWASFVGGHARDAEQWLDESARVFTEIGDWGGLGWVLGLLGWVRFQQGHLAEAEALATQIVEESRDLGDRWAAGMMLVLLASVRLWQGRTEEALPPAREAREIFRNLEDPIDEMRAIGPLSRALVALGRGDEARELLEEAYARAERSEHRDAKGWAALVAGSANAHLGDADRAMRAAHLLADAEDDRAGDDVVWPERLVMLGVAKLMGGDPEMGRAALEEAAERSGEGPKSNAMAYLALARVATGDAAAAVEAADAMLDNPRRTYMDTAVAQVAKGFALVRAGDAKGATAILDDAVATVDATGDLVMQAVARLAKGTALAAMESAESAGPTTEARSRLANLGVEAAGWERAFLLAVRGGVVSP